MRAPLSTPWRQINGSFFLSFFFPSFRVKTMGLSAGVIHVLSTDEDCLLIAVGGQKVNNSGPTGSLHAQSRFVYQARAGWGGYQCVQAKIPVTTFQETSPTFVLCWTVRGLLRARAHSLSFGLCVASCAAPGADTVFRSSPGLGRRTACHG